jgi:predicted dehydrogenase
MEVIIVGLGSIAAKHILALKQIDDKVNIKALRSSRNAAIISGITNIYDVKDIGKPNFVIISNPTYLHAGTIKLFAERNIPMFIEKPVVNTLEHIVELTQLIELKDAVTYTACNLRFHPCINFLKKYLAYNDIFINEVNIYCGSYLPDWRPGKNYQDIYSAHLSMGGGVHLDLFHEMDYTCWIFGYPESYKGFSSSKSGLKIEAPDYGNYLLSYANFNVSIVLNYYRKEPKRSIEILFKEETWLVDLIANKIMSASGTVIFEDQRFKMIDTYIDQMRYFISHLESDIPPMNSFKESVEILKISLANESLKG